MGKVEKIVVLSVLFVVTVIIALSLKTGAKKAEAAELATAEPVEAAVTLDQEPVQPTPSPVERTVSAPRLNLDSRRADRQRTEPVEVSGGSNGLLNSSVAPVEEPVQPLRVEIPDDWDLVTLTGLNDTFYDDFKVYTCRANDTFEKVAARLYGSADKAELLRRNNEGIDRLPVGGTILIPVRDDVADDSRAHVVEDGEHLWGIAKRFYGAGSRWQDIFDANRDVLATPESIRAGMTLRIP